VTPALRPAQATDAYRLQLLARSPDPPCWVAEVENWAIRDSWHWYRDPTNLSATLLLADDEAGDLVAIIGYQRIAKRTWYLPGLLVAPESRGRGIGSHVFRTTLDELRRCHPGQRALWAVHHHNASMVHVSRSLGATSTPIDLTCNGGSPEGYLRFELRL